LRQGQSLEEFIATRDAIADGWAKWFRAEMDKFGAEDPVEVLPNALARIEQHAIAEAREAAKAAAQAEVRTMLRRAIA
jgi:hypothetical protein